MQLNMLHAPAINLILRYCGDFFLVLVCGGVFWQRLYLRMPVFATYVAAEVIGTVATNWICYKTGLTSYLYFYSWYLKDAVIFSLIGACVFEIASAICRQYIGLRRLVFQALYFLGTISLLACAIDLYFHKHDLVTIIYVLERDVTFAETLLLLMTCLIPSYYGIFPIFFERYAILGFGLDLIIQYINYDSFLRLGNTKSVYMTFAIIAHGGWDLILLIWLAGLLRKAPLPACKTKENFHRLPKGNGAWIHLWEWREVSAFPSSRTLRSTADLVHPRSSSLDLQSHESNVTIRHAQNIHCDSL